MVSSIPRIHDRPSLPHEVIIISGGLPICLSVWKRHPTACTAVFYPSTMASPLLHRHFLHKLWCMGLNVVGVHPVGHGHSPRHGDTFVFGDLLRNGMDAVTWTLEHMEGPVVVTGHSQGGILTLAHAAVDARIAAAFPLCTLLPQHPEAGHVTRFHTVLRHRERLKTILRVGAHLLPRFPVLIPFYLDYSRITAGSRRPERPWGYMRMHYPLRFVSSLFHTDLSAVCTPGHIRCPVVLMVARDDALFPPEIMRTMLECVYAPEKRLVYISGGGHMAPLCADFVTETAALLAGHCAGMGLPLHECGREIPDDDSCY